MPCNPQAQLVRDGIFLEVKPRSNLTARVSSAWYSLVDVHVDQPGLAAPRQILLCLAAEEKALGRPCDYLSDVESRAKTVSPCSFVGLHCEDILQRISRLDH